MFDEVGVFSRIHGIRLNNASNTIITTNKGKISGTVINSLSASNGYIMNNTGIDINPIINNTT